MMVFCVPGACRLLSVTLENALWDIVLKDHTKAHIGRVQPNKLYTHSNM